MSEAHDTSRIDVEDTGWPTVIVRVQGAPTGLQVSAYLARIDTMLARKDAYALLVLAGKEVSLGFQQRRLLTRHVRTNAAKIALYNVGTAFVIRSPVARALLAAMMAVFPQPSPHAVVSTEDEARAFLRMRLTATGVSPPDTAR
jgi:hypothetical protein